jgi:hypothetical protein
VLSGYILALQHGAQRGSPNCFTTKVKPSDER